MNHKKEFKKAQSKPKDLYAFRNPQTDSSFGVMLRSEKPSNPKFGFGTSTRQQWQKVLYDKRIAEQMLLGQTSQGPIYTPQFEKTQSLSKRPVFDHEQRKPLNNKQIYQFNKLDDKLFNPDQAKDKTLKQEIQPLFGTEEKFFTLNKPLSPGYTYNPLEEQFKFKKNPNYSIGHWLKNGLFDNHNNQQTNIVAPNQYYPKENYTTKFKTNAQVKIGQQRRFPEQCLLNRNTNQTFETYSSLWNQIKSNKRNSCQVKFDHAKKDTQYYIPKYDQIGVVTKLNLVHNKY